MMPAKAALAGGATVPVIWSVLGYQFEAASMIAGISACLMVRIWVSLTDKSRHGIAIDVTVTGISLLFTAGWIISQRPEPFYALMSGTGFGALGAGIIAIALRWVKKGQALLGDTDETTRPMPRPDDRAAIEAALRALHDKPMPDETQP